MVTRPGLIGGRQRMPRPTPALLPLAGEGATQGRMRLLAQRAAFASLLQSRSRASLAARAPPPPALRATFSRRRETGFVRRCSPIGSAQYGESGSQDVEN